ncbi:MAG: S8 family serine peptidase, partial [Acidimicrobiales bacterium]
MCVPRRRCARALPVLAALVVLVAGPAGAQTAPTNDPGSGLEWHLNVIGAPRAWPVATGKGTTIAIVDTGVDLAHEDLVGRISGRATCLDTGGDSLRCTDGGPDDGRDDDGHGTHVAGIAAATGSNGTGVVGVAPDANILAVKVLRTCAGATACDATGSASDVEAGIRWATDHGATVINLSLGSTTQSLFGSGFGDAISYAWGAGAIPVVASGNSLLLSSGFSSENAIVVNSLNRSGLKASYASNVGSAHWALSAPGGEGDTATSCATAPQGILSTYWTRGGSGYACLAGTSMAAPQVSGAAAILRSA